MPTWDRKMDLNQVKRMVEQFKNGETKIVLAKRFGISPMGVYYWIRKMKISGSELKRGKGLPMEMEPKGHQVEKEPGYGCKKCGYRTMVPREWGKHVFECKMPKPKTEVWE